jgi:hypothetical protein
VDVPEKEILKSIRVTNGLLKRGFDHEKPAPSIHPVHHHDLQDHHSRTKDHKQCQCLNGVSPIVGGEG